MVGIPRMSVNTSLQIEPPICGTMAGLALAERCSERGHELRPGMIGLGARGGEAAVVDGGRRHHLHAREALGVEMALQRRHDGVDIGAGDEAQLAVGDRLGRDGVHRPARRAGGEGQHVEHVGAVDALGRRQARLAPPRVDLRPVSPPSISTSASAVLHGRATWPAP